MSAFNQLYLDNILLSLEKSPEVLRNLVAVIPKALLKASPWKGAWTIHEHACHIGSGDRIGVLYRFDQFMNEDCPMIQPLSGDSFPKDFLLDMDLNQILEHFVEDRKKVVHLARLAHADFWEKPAMHPEYSIYTPFIMLRHRLMHDYLHMYRIEELWLSKEAPPCLPSKEH